MSDAPAPFDRFRRRTAARVCETPGCGRPSIGPVGIVTQTPIVFPCATCAQATYGTADHWGIIAVMLGERPMSNREAAAILFGGPVLVPDPEP